MHSGRIRSHAFWSDPDLDFVLFLNRFLFSIKGLDPEFIFAFGSGLEFVLGVRFGVRITGGSDRVFSSR